MTERSRERWHGLLEVLSRPVDVAWLAAFRTLFGLTVCVSMLRFLAYGWIDQFFVKPAFHFKYWGFGWVEPLPGGALHLLFAVLAGLGLAMALGLFFRAAALLFALGFVYLQLLDVTNYLNHYYLAALLAVLLAASPAHRAWSLDAWLRPRIATREVPALWLYWLRFQVGVVYTFAGLAKLHGDWLLHAQPLRIWTASKTGLPYVGALFSFEETALLMSWAGFLFDTCVVWLLLVRRLRPVAYAAVLVFHAATRALFPIGMFPVIMVLSALVFFPPDWPRRWIALFQRAFRITPNLAPVAPQAPAPLPRALLVVVAAWCVVQVAMPLRFLAYGGNVRWHEQGMRFSWRVMVREKNGSVTFHVRQKSGGREWTVSPASYLTRLQEREMSGQPDLILQLAHRIRDDFEAAGHGPVEVHADTLVSLNGRRAQPLVDPQVDLAAIHDGLGRAEWILPAPDAPPPHLRPVSSL